MNPWKGEYHFMKKFTAIALVLVMLVSLFALTSCEEKKLTAYSLVSDAVAKMETLDSFEADMEIKMGVETMGVSMDVPMQYNVKAAGLKGDNPVTFSTVSMTMMGMTMKTEAYTEGEWCYITAFGQNMKMKAGENTEEYDGYADIESVIKELPEDILSDVEITENSDGTKTVSVAVSDEKFAEIYKSFVDEMSASAAEGEEVSEVSVTNAKVTVTVDKNGYISVYGISFDMNLKAESEGMSLEMKASVDMNIAFKNPGTAVTITPPAGYQDFEEVDPEELVA
jgi:lipoprotein